MNSAVAQKLVPVEFYIGPQVLSGHLSIASGRRLLDLLNRLGEVDRDVQSEYIEFMSDEGLRDSQTLRYVRKTSVELAALSEANLARGAGAPESTRVNPRVDKLTVSVNIKTPRFLLDGEMHFVPGRTVRDVLDEDTLFLPLTDVTIVYENHLYGNRPFVAVRKEQVISVEEQKAD